MTTLNTSANSPHQNEPSTSEQPEDVHAHQTQSARDDSAYAGVTVWIGNKSITRTVPLEQFGQLYSDPLTAQFADANAELRVSRWSDAAPMR